MATRGDSAVFKCKVIGADTTGFLGYDSVDKIPFLQFVIFRRWSFRPGTHKGRPVANRSPRVIARRSRPGTISDSPVASSRPAATFRPCTRRTPAMTTGGRHVGRARGSFANQVCYLGRRNSS
ncbi:hypothetical protein K402DRAFT_408724 [Aulographum hederae CBS 113979]|uniref:Uncharacterized protein n=1 Tax=Aulographum hederae CBS 113979 TaxID=1176131 RepID=A0A6G1GJX5_9PEZI|nr:hypothetical protein K402DRAFT_408724 [Aulographum hederae CBS 113979]